MKVTLYASMDLVGMDRTDKIRACYQHCCLKNVSSAIMTNQTLRERLRIDEKNYATASRIINDTIKQGLIKYQDPTSKSKKYAKYIPFWA
jgi:predicted HTH transcriptional regulator